ncbi:MAG: ABC transporter permease [Polyangiaceae bacterium]|nr:ABC transporter permease [Polyangiaceae bacterium]
MLWTTLVMAFREIRRNALRSFLTTLGIVIGVGAVIAMVTLGQGATIKVTGDVAKMGNNLLTVSPGSERRGAVSVAATMFTLDDANAIRREVSSVRFVAPTASRSTSMVYANRNYTATVTGSINAYLDVRGYALDRGRIFSETEQRVGMPVCVLGETVRKELFGPEEALDATIRVGKLACKVVGVFASKGQSTFGFDQDDFVLMPLATFQRRIAGTTDVGAIFVSARDEGSTVKAKRQIESLMRERRRIALGAAPDFAVRDMKEISDTLATITRALTALLGAVAAVSLLVGGIGIMNIMLVSVTERTREIGIRMAIGARAHEVLLQFVVEAIVLSVLGGLLGMGLGLAGSFAVARLVGLPFVLMPEVVLLAFAFSAAVGIAFGIFPARKASRLNPIEALRHE